MNGMNHRTLAALALSTCTLLALGLGLGACSSDKSTATSAETTDPGSTETTDPGSLTTEPLVGGSTTAPPTTPAPTAPPTAPPTSPAPTGPKVKTLTTPSTNPTCAEVTANGNQATVSWSATNAASVSLSIDGPGVYADGLPATGSYDIPASCGDTQIVLITSYDAGGNPGGTKTITITIGS
ncbi:MAG: hypothetical protein Q7V57_08830 [Actinomycetota bacterium]|nr:hypothetical protein [Actinomycetota bacterium]